MVDFSRTIEPVRAPRLDGRVALITGSGRGFGRELALAYARAGARVVLTAGRNRAELDEALAMVDAIAPGSAVGMVSDVASPGDCDRLLDMACSSFGAIDILINNAARRPIDAMPVYDVVNPMPFWTPAPDRYADIVMTKVVGPYLMARALVPAMVERGFGRIINISTSRPTMFRRGSAPYGATKAALEVSTRVWADDLQGTGVTVNALLPGAASDTALIPGKNIGTRSLDNFCLAMVRAGSRLDGRAAAGRHFGAARALDCIRPFGCMDGKAHHRQGLEPEYRSVRGCHCGQFRTVGNAEHLMKVDSDCRREDNP